MFAESRSGQDKNSDCDFLVIQDRATANPALGHNLAIEHVIQNMQVADASGFQILLAIGLKGHTKLYVQSGTTRHPLTERGRPVRFRSFEAALRYLTQIEARPIRLAMEVCPRESRRADTTTKDY